MKAMKCFALILLSFILFTSCARNSSETVSSAVSARSSAVKIDKNLGKSLYGDQTAVSNAIKKCPKIMNELKSYKISIDTTTIMPEYSADLFDYAKTGSFKYTPEMNTDAQVYYAKAVNSEGKFAANIEFTVDGSDPEVTCYSPSNTSVYSFSYADNEKKILKLAKKSSLLPSEVRLIRINDLGLVYYINDGTSEAFVAEDNGNEDIFNNKNGGIVYINDSLKKSADIELKKDNERTASMKANANSGNPITG